MTKRPIWFLTTHKINDKIIEVGYTAWFYSKKLAIEASKNNFYYDDGYYNFACISKCYSGKLIPESSEWYSVDSRHNHMSILIKLKKSPYKNVIDVFWK